MKTAYAHITDELDRDFKLKILKENKRKKENKTRKDIITELLTQYTYGRKTK